MQVRLNIFIDHGSKILLLRCPRPEGGILYGNKENEQSLEILCMYIDLNPEANDIDRILELVKQIRNLLP